MGTAVFGAPEFKARSGRKVKLLEDGTVVFDHVNGYLSPGSAMDAEEFFQAKEDERLGRWRWPDNPEFVVYRRVDDGRDLATVFREMDGTQATYDRDEFPTTDIEKWKTHRLAARAYFEAHPVVKPPSPEEVVEQLRSEDTVLASQAADLIESLRRGRS